MLVVDLSVLFFQKRILVNLFLAEDAENVVGIFFLLLSSTLLLENVLVQHNEYN